MHIRKDPGQVNATVFFDHHSAGRRLTRIQDSDVRDEFLRIAASERNGIALQAGGQKSGVAAATTKRAVGTFSIALKLI